MDMKRFYLPLIVLLTISLLIVSSIAILFMFERSISDLTTELLAAAIAVVLVVASVGVTLYFQTRMEEARDRQGEIFKTKLVVYQELLNELNAADDLEEFHGPGNTTETTGVEVTYEELSGIINGVRNVILVGSDGLIKELFAYVQKIKDERRLFVKEGQQTKGTFAAVLSLMRDDLGVGQATKDAREDSILRQEIRNFMEFTSNLDNTSSKA